MTREHWIELLEAGPVISSEDMKRLKTIIPQRIKISVAVELAHSGMDWRYEPTA